METTGILYNEKTDSLYLHARELKTDDEPVEIFERFASRTYSCFLDSSLVMPGLGRYSFIGFDPYLVLGFKNGIATFAHRSGHSYTEKMKPFDALRRALSFRNLEGGVPEGYCMPFVCGGIGYLSYELGKYLERLPGRAKDDIHIPELCFCFFDKVISFDLITGEKRISVALPAREEPNDAFEEIEEVLAGKPADDSCEKRETSPAADESEVDFERTFSKDEYIEAVRRVKEYILAGDIYQANLSQRFSCPIRESAWSLYRRLRVLNAAPFSAFLNFGGFAIASSSPERFIKVEGRRVQTRPIKGTISRSDDPAVDERNKKKLLSSEKDLAELSMIVDLERNDLGRVCEYGTVKVEEHAVLESYATVHHLVSTVTGTLLDGKDIIDLLKASFPGGSITGAPKIRSMEIIDELEPTQRSVYTGGIGYLGLSGNHDINVAIRTMIIKDGRAYFQVGGGIVADSDPEEEYMETLHKGRAMFKAITGRKAEMY